MLIPSEKCTNLGKVIFSFDEVAHLLPVLPGTFSLFFFFFSLMGNVGIKWQGLSQKGKLTVVFV